jgi:hypothetical protein
VKRGFDRYGPGPVTDGAPPVDSRPLGLDDLGKLARRGVRAVTRAARADDQVSLAGLLAGHLGKAGIGEDVVEETWPAYEHVNVQAGLDAWLASRTSELVGVVNFRHRPFGLAELVAMAGQPADPYGPRPGNAATVNLPCGPDGETRACLRCAVHLVEDGDGVRTALLVRAAEPETGIDRVSVQALSTSAEAARAAVRDIRAAAERENVFRGQVLSFGGEVFGHGQTLLQFHRRPHLAAGQLVLPASTLGQLTGGALHLIAEACSVAPTLQPALIVVEDVDLIAEDRGMHPGHHPLLFQLLDEMDGLAEDADVVFLLTTNRADLLEPALAARPGRADQAVELTLPDRDARRALFDLYRGDLAIDVSRLDDVLDRTDGVTASFLKELIRRAALFAAERTADGELSVSAGDLTSALDELLHTRNAMTRTLLGAAT